MLSRTATLWAHRAVTVERRAPPSRGRYVVGRGPAARAPHIRAPWDQSPWSSREWTVNRPERGNMIIGAHGGRRQLAQDPHRTHLGPDGVRFLIQPRGPQAPLPYRWPQGTRTRRHVVPRGQVARSSTSTTFSVPSRADRSRPSRNPLGRAFLGGFTQSPRGDPSHAGTSTTSSTPPTSYTTWCDDPSGSTVTCRRAPAESDDVAVSERSTAVSGSAAARHRRTGTTAVVKILVFTA